MNNNPKKYDVIIVGSGIVGLTLAASLAKTNLKIALCDARAPQVSWDIEQFDLRVSAITPRSVNIFQELSCWDAIQAERISPFNKMHVWDAKGDGYIDFNSIMLGCSELGYIIENRVIRKTLFEHIQKFTNIDILIPMLLKDVSYANELATLTSDQGEQLQADLVVGADGANSWLREKLAIAYKTWDYGHNAVVATIKSEKSHQACAWQRFLPDGPLAFLPLNDPANTQQYASIVWSTTPERAESLAIMEDQFFLRELTKAFDSRLGNALETTKRFQFPLRMRHCNEYVKPGFALVGDAAHTIHPLAGQGVNLGILDAEALAKAIKNAAEKNRALGHISSLRPYERARKADNWKMIAVVEGFKQLFGEAPNSVSWLRNRGLQITNKFDLIKKLIMRSAMGELTF